ncbi:hypothetical protein Dimus_032175, partial [Dionaea muscipula]
MDLDLNLGFSDDDGFAMWTPFLAVAASDVACLTGDLGFLPCRSGFDYSVAAYPSLPLSPAGFTFVKFTSKHDAEKAILKFNGQQFDNRTLAIDRALPKKIYTAAGNSAIDFEDGSWIIIGSFLAVVAFDYACLADDLGLPCFADMGSILLRPPLPLCLPLTNDAPLIGIGRGYVEDVGDSNQVLYEEQTLEETLYHFVRQEELLEFMDYQKVAKLLCVVDFGGLV